MGRILTGTDGIRAMMMRGGTSKGLYFLAEDLPADTAERDDLLLRIMGTPDRRQIDGLGGAHPLTSKVAVVSSSPDPDADVEYLFLQVGVDEAFVTDRQNCGNLLAGIGPFSIERGLVAAQTETTRIRIHMVNNGVTATAVIRTPEGTVEYAGSTAISGVPGTAAPVVIEFNDIAGSTTGALFPTGNLIDEFDGMTVTCVDNGMPVVVIPAADLGVTGAESCDELEADGELTARVEAVRLRAGDAMGLGDVSALTIPKMTLVSPPAEGGTIRTRTFIPHRCHQAIGVLGAVSVATAAVVRSTVAAELAAQVVDGRVGCEHPSGTFEAIVELDETSPEPAVARAGVVRTTRKLFDGFVFPRDG
jgi:4-oxalomesaconate tautomerase